MFFRTPKPQTWTFDQRLANLKQFGFETACDAGKTIVKRQGFAAAVEDLGAGKVGIGKSGILAGNEIAGLVHGGYQMFFHTPSGRELPAQAHQLKGLHAFDEDLREGLGLTSLYNKSLGTVCEDHLYDRLEERDEQPQPKPWEKKAART